MPWWWCTSRWWNNGDGGEGGEGGSDVGGVGVDGDEDSRSNEIGTSSCDAGISSTESGIISTDAGTSDTNSTGPALHWDDTIEDIVEYIVAGWWVQGVGRGGEGCSVDDKPIVSPIACQFSHYRESRRALSALYS